MKRILLTALVCASAMLAQRPGATQKATAQKEANQQAPAKAAAKLEIPPDATKIDQYTYRHKDAQGKTWIYKRTPFGLSRMEETVAEAPQPKLGEAEVKVTEQGDNITFERQGPFGKSTWSKRRSELTSEEQGFLQQAGSAKQPATPEAQKNQ